MAKKLTPAEKWAKMLKILETEKALANKADVPCSVGVLEDFGISGRENYFITGILGIDANTNGYKKGTFNVLYGEESSGKSTIALESIAAFQQVNPEAIILYIDTEQTVDDAFLDRIPGIKKDKIIFIKDVGMERIFDKIDEYTKEGVVDFIVIDSIDSMVPMKEEEKSLEDNVMMARANILSRGLAKINPSIYQNGIIVLMIQQKRINFNGMIAKTNGRSGGNAAKFYPATVNLLTKQTSLNDAKDDIQGTKVVNQFCKIRNEKSKISEPYRETATFLNTDRTIKAGVSKMRELLHYAILFNVIESSGAWCSYTDLDTGEIIKVNGKNKMMQELAKNINLFSNLKFQIYGKILPPELLISKFDEIKTLLEKENEIMKKNKINILIVQGKSELITEEDTKVFTLKDKEILDIISKEEYDLGIFNLKSDEEKKQFLDEKKQEEEKNQQKQSLDDLNIEIVKQDNEE